MVLKTVAIILARGGSKTIPRKNIKRLCDTNCVELTIKSLLTVLKPSEILLSSDSREILDVGIKNNILTLIRPDKYSTDIASSESAWLNAIEYLHNKGLFPDQIIAPQVTCPLRYKSTFSKALNKFLANKYDSLFSAIEISPHTFEWEFNNQKKIINPLNYDPFVLRKRRQDNKNHILKIRENGSFFIFKTNGFLEKKSRLFGNVGFFLQDSIESIDIDDLNDWIIVESIFSKNKSLFSY